MEDQQPHGVKRKRDKYVVRACTECKRRKIKCNGETPCERCNNLALECIYQPRTSPNDESNATLQVLQEKLNNVTNQLESLQKTVNYLVTLSIANVADKTPMIPGAHSRSKSVTNASETMSDDSSIHPAPDSGSTAYNGPTSARFSMTVAKKALASWGIDGGELVKDREPTIFTAVPPSVMSPPGAETPLGNRDSMYAPIQTLPRSLPPYETRQSVQSPWEPLLVSVGKQEAMHLIDVYGDEVNSLYMTLAISEFKVFFGPIWDDNNEENVTNYPTVDICLIKMVLAIAMAILERQEAVAKKFYEQVLTVIERKLLTGVADMDTLSLLVLVHIYQFQTDLVPQSYRTIGFASRICNEIGLHCAEEVDRILPGSGEKCFAIRLFWVVYILDRRLAFSMGLPFSLRDEDINQVLPSLVKPDGQELDNLETTQVAFLQSMVEYSKIFSKLWATVSRMGSLPTLRESKLSSPEEIHELESSIQEWLDNLPSQLKYGFSDTNPYNSEDLQRTPLWLTKLQVLLFIRANQMRLHIFRPYLLSPTLIKTNFRYASRAVDLAKESIRVLNNFNKTTPLYMSCQSHYNHFLVTALAVLFIAIIHDPKSFCGKMNCRIEFDMAIDLVRVLKRDSNIGMRLWTTIKGLKGIARKISGLSRSAEPSQRASPEAGNEEDPRRGSVTTSNSKLLGQLNVENSESTFMTKGSPSVSASRTEHMPFSSSLTPPVQDFDMSTELNEIFFLATTGNNIAADGNGFLLNENNPMSGWEEAVAANPANNVSYHDRTNRHDETMGSYPFGVWPDEDLTKALGPWL